MPPPRASWMRGRSTSKARRSTRQRMRSRRRSPRGELLQTLVVLHVAIAELAGPGGRHERLECLRGLARRRELELDLAGLFDGLERAAVVAALAALALGGDTLLVLEFEFASCPVRRLV